MRFPMAAPLVAIFPLLMVSFLTVVFLRGEGESWSSHCGLRISECGLGEPEPLWPVLAAFGRVPCLCRSLMIAVLLPVPLPDSPVRGMKVAVLLPVIECTPLALAGGSVIASALLIKYA